MMGGLTFRDPARRTDQLHHLRAHLNVLLGLEVVLLLALAVGDLDLVEEVVRAQGADH